jgi:hypothetical protein
MPVLLRRNSNETQGLHAVTLGMEAQGPLSFG